MPILSDFNIPCLTGLVCGIIGNIDLLAVVAFGIPFIQKPDTLIRRNSCNKIRHLGIAVNPHFIRKKRMVVTIIRIVLTGIIFRNDGVGREIQKKAAVFANDPFHHLIQSVVCNEFSDQDIGTDSETAAPLGTILFFRQFNLREIFQKVRIRVHQLWIRRFHLSNRRALRNIIFFLRHVSAAIGVFNIGGPVSSVE